MVNRIGGEDEDEDEHNDQERLLGGAKWYT